MSDKAPWFKLFPKDWMSDPALRRCSPAARGVWIDILCVAHGCPERGVLVASDGTPLTLSQIAGSIGGERAVNLTLIDELLREDVARKRDDGAIFSARMVRDTESSEYFKSCGKRRGKRGGVKPPPTGGAIGGGVPPPTGGAIGGGVPPPASLSGSGSDSSVKGECERETRFDDFWSAWPSHFRKLGKGKCLKLWIAERLDAEADAIIAHVKASASSEQWTKDGGQFIPGPIVYLRNRRWDAPAPPAPDDGEFKMYKLMPKKSGAEIRAMLAACDEQEREEAEADAKRGSA